jgi:hypothetical protein
LPDASCGTAGNAFLVAHPAGANVEVVHRGKARHGFAIEETYRSIPDNPLFETRLELLDFSEAPLDDALFAIPRDYVPALPLPHGGYDMSREDTVVNRLKTYWNVGVDWVTYWLRW